MAKPREYSAETDQAIIELKLAGWKNAQIAAAFCISPIALEHHITRRRRQGLQGPFRDRPKNSVRERPADNPIAGETWTDVPARGLSVSSHGRVLSLRSGYLRSVYKQGRNGAPATNFETDDRRGTVTIDTLQREARGDFEKPKRSAHSRVRLRRLATEPKGRSRPWYTPEEDALIREARSLVLAQQALSHRSPESVRNRVKLLSVRFTKWEPAPVGSPARGRADPEAAKAVVPKTYPPEVREDLINDIVIMQLDGFQGTAAEAFKIAKTRHYRMFDQHRTTSIDAPLAGADGFRLSDLISSDHPHF